MVIKGLLEINPTDRLNVQQILNMTIFTKVKEQFASKEEGKKQMERLKNIAEKKVKMKAEETSTNQHQQNPDFANKRNGEEPHVYMKIEKDKKVVTRPNFFSAANSEPRHSTEIPISGQQEMEKESVHPESSEFGNK
jgi:hypothetical protein